jgi:hypothetical protein
VHRDTQTQPTLALVDLYSSSEPKIGLTLELPRLSEGAVVKELLVSSSSDGDHGRGGPGAAAEAPFHTTDLDRLVVIRLNVSSTTALGSPGEQYTIFLPIRQLLTLGPKREAILPWEAWGPNSTRMLCLRRMRLVVENQAGYGMRYAHTHIESGNGSRAGVYTLYFFYPPISSAESSGTNAMSTGKTQDGTGPAALNHRVESSEQTYSSAQPTVIESRFFADTISTTLPYGKRVVHGPIASAAIATADGLVIFEACIVIIVPFHILILIISFSKE